MRRTRVLALSLALASVAWAPPVSAGLPDGRMIDYRSEAAYVPATPSVSGGAVGAFSNPASWATNDVAEMAFWWNDASLRAGSLDNFGLSMGRNVGFAMQRAVLGTRQENMSLYDYQLGLALGSRAGCFGAAWRWSSGADEIVGRRDALVLGAIGRPAAWISWGLSGAFAGKTDARTGVFDLGVRPLGKPWLTLFGDYSLCESDRPEDGFWGAGVEVRPIRGISLGAKVREVAGEDDYDYSLHFGLTLDGCGFHLLPSYNQDGERREKSGALRPTTYLVRFDPPHGGLPAKDLARRAFGSNRYVELDFHDKSLTYQKARYFDDVRIAWLDLERELDAIQKDRSVRGVAINLSGFSAPMSLAWEFRQKLADIRASGKEVIVQIEEGSMGSYYLASVADHLVMDPEANLMIPGLAAKRTYMKGLLEKAGVGFEEWRFMEYKSAMESFSRDDMSAADREQIGRAIDQIYETMRAEISESRGLSTDRFDRILEDNLIFTAKAAQASGLVDRIGRWHDLDDWLEKERDGAQLGAPCYDALSRVYYDDRWGRPPEVSVVYALGECAMDTGIRGRTTSEYLRKLAEKDGVAAVVLRADSPGGDPLASDLVAEGMDKIKEAKKPMVVSQGNVAGSGGYWISMPGNPIFTTPLTITGSIGVIGGWFYDQGLGKKTGFSADGVQRGSHSDLLTGIRFPLLGQVPTRNLNDGERTMVRGLILGIYDDFVGKVAKARGMSEEDVRKVGAGRIWMGEDAIDRHLCDRVGTLPQAIEEARTRAGLDPDDEVTVTEFPARPWFELPKMFPSLPGLSMAARALGGYFGRDAVLAAPEEDYSMVYLRAIAEARGAPLVLTPPEALPDGWYEE